MASSTEICNMALSHLAVAKEIANIETEQSQEASACRRFYDIARDYTLRDFLWPFARRYQALGLVEEDPNTEWAFSYRYPSDCLKIHKIKGINRNETRQSKVSYQIAQDSIGLLIYTDAEDAEIVYTYKETDPQKYMPDFIMAFSFRLAAYIAPRLTAGDPFKLGDRAMQMYTIEISRAAANSVNEQQYDEEVQSELIRARE